MFTALLEGISCDECAKHPEWQAIRGCKKRGRHFFTLRDEGGKVYRIWRCPLAIATPFEWELVRLWSYYHVHGILPEAGGIYDQPAFLFDAFDVLDAIYTERRRREEEKWLTEVRQQVRRYR